MEVLRTLFMAGLVLERIQKTVLTTVEVLRGLCTPVLA